MHLFILTTSVRFGQDALRLNSLIVKLKSGRQFKSHISLPTALPYLRCSIGFKVGSSSWFSWVFTIGVPIALLWSIRHSESKDWIYFLGALHLIVSEVSCHSTPRIFASSLQELSPNVAEELSPTHSAIPKVAIWCCYQNIVCVHRHECTFEALVIEQLWFALCSSPSTCMSNFCKMNVEIFRRST